MKKKNLITIAIVVAIVFTGVFAVIHAKRKENALPVAEKYQMTVSVIKAKLMQTMLTLPYLAIVQNDRDVNLTSKVSGRIMFLERSGSVVKRGQIIARFDNTSITSSKKSIEAQISAQKITLANLQSTHNRTLQLLAVKGASKEQSETEESKISATQASIESLNQNLRDIDNTLTYTTIASPVDGIISKTMGNIGDVVMPGQPLVLISANSDFYLSVLVPTNLNVYGIMVDKVKYDAIALNSTSNNLAQYKVYVDSKNLISGDRIEVDVVIYDNMAVKLPFDAVLNREGVNAVLVKENNKAVAKKINIIQSGEDGVVISNNELANKEVIVAKQDILLTLLSGVSIKTREE